MDYTTRIRIFDELSIHQNNVQNMSSWLDLIDTLPEKLKLTNSQFEDVWNKRPEERGKVKIYGKILDVPRYQQSFGKKYEFSGLMHNERNINDISLLSNLLEWCNNDLKDNYLNELKYYNNYIDNSGETNYMNGILINWYENGLEYIGPHSDDEKQLMLNFPIYSFSYGQCRDFKLHCKKGISTKDFSVGLKNNSCVIMGGLMQKTHKHSLPIRKKITGKRINITIRAFKN